MADVDGVTGQGSEVDSVASIEANVTEAPQQGQASEQASTEQAIADALLELDGEQFTEADIRAWKDAHQNMSKWRGELSKKGEEVNAMARAMEQARQAMLQPQQPQQSYQQPQSQGGFQPVPTEQLVPVLQAAILEGNPQALQQLQGWISNLAKQEASTTIGTVTEQQQIKQKFLSEYSDFENTISTPEFQAFHQQHPEYNAVNAYAFYQISNLKAQMAEAEKAGFLKGEQNTIKQMQAKQGLKVLRGGTSAPTPAAPDIKGMDNHRIRMEAAQRIMEARAQNGG